MASSWGSRGQARGRDRAPYYGNDDAYDNWGAGGRRGGRGPFRGRGPMHLSSSQMSINPWVDKSFVYRRQTQNYPVGGGYGYGGYSQPRLHSNPRPKLFRTARQPTRHELEWKERQRTLLKAEYEQFEPIPGVTNDQLICDICDIGPFTSQHAYAKHIQSDPHIDVLRTSYDKMMSMVKFLRIKSKHEERRRGDPALISCNYCLVKITGSHKDHNNSAQHKEVKRVLNRKCCGVVHSNKLACMRHQCTIKHKLMYKAEVEAHELMLNKYPGVSMFDDCQLYKNHCDSIEREWLLTKNVEEEYTLENLPTLESGVPIGTLYINMFKAFHCSLCKVTLRNRDDELEQHIVGVEHFNNVVKHLKTNKYEAFLREVARKDVEEKLAAPIEGEQNKRALEDQDQDDDDVLYNEEEWSHISEGLGEEICDDDDYLDNRGDTSRGNDAMETGWVYQK